jgi:hypothetical protein
MVLSVHRQREMNRGVDLELGVHIPRGPGLVWKNKKVVKVDNTGDIEKVTQSVRNVFRFEKLRGRWKDPWA